MPTSTDNVIFSGTIPSAADSYDAGTSESGYWTFHGTYNRLTYYDNPTTAPAGTATITGRVFGFAATPDDNGVQAGEFVRADDGAGVPPFRCYLTYSGNNSALLARGVTRGESEEVPETIIVRLIGKNGETDGIGTLTLSTGEFTSEGWYSLDGRKLDGKPTKKGLYIHNGNKVVIK